MAEAAQDPPVGPRADHVWRPGLMTEDDVDDYFAPEREPARISYRGLEGYRLRASDRTQALHLLLEAGRFAFADRNAYLADPDLFDVPLEGLLSDSFAAERRALIHRNRAATSPVPPGDPYDNQDDRDRGRGRSSATISHPRQSTTHLVVSDRN